MKLGIGCLTMFMMLGTVLFSVQAFCFASQPAVSQYSINDNDAAASDDNVQRADPDSHSMDTRSESNGFFAIPWISVSYIRQSIGEASLLQSARKLTRSLLFSAYSFGRTIGVTDKTVRSRSNSSCQVQALDLQIARWTAG